MGRRSTGGAVRGLASALVVCCALVAPAVAPAQAGPAPGVIPPWLLPALPTPTDVQPGPVPRCAQATIRCVDATIAVMERLERDLGCDHRAVFATTYLTLTREARAMLAREPSAFRYREWLIYLDVVFANYYFDTLADDAAGRSVPEAWRIAFDAAANRDVLASQDMLLGINAHVQRDMPYVLAEVGLRARNGDSRKVDHDAFNEVLRRSYEAVVRTVERRYDPSLATTNPAGDPADDIAGLELVKLWREGVWRNAERLLNARTPAEREFVERQIEDNAAAWARSIASSLTPGYRATRDAYCRRRGAGRGAAANRPAFAIRLTVSPTRTTGGRPTTFAFRATTTAAPELAGRPVAGATVRFAGRTARTDARGRARIATLRLRRPGLVAARATRAGLRPGTARVRVTAAGRPRGFTGAR